MSYASPAYGPGQPALPRRRSGLTTAGKIIFFIGLVLSLVALAVGIWGFSQLMSSLDTWEDDSIVVQGSESVPMDLDDTRFILADEGTDPACTVAGPSGQDVPVTSDPTLDQAAAQEGMGVLGSFTATEAGQYTVTCDSPARLTPAIGMSDVLGLGALLGFLALFPLGFLTLLGLVLWLVGRSRDKKAALAPQQAGPGYEYGYGAPAGYQPGPTYGTGAHPGPPSAPGSAGQPSMPAADPQASPWATPPAPGQAPTDGPDERR